MKRVDVYNFLKGQFLSQQEVAEILRVSEDTVRRRADEGLLKRVYDGRLPRFCAYSVQNYLHTHTSEPGAAK